MKYIFTETDGSLTPLSFTEKSKSFRDDLEIFQTAWSGDSGASWGWYWLEHGQRSSHGRFLGQVADLSGTEGTFQC